MKSPSGNEVMPEKLNRLQFLKQSGIIKPQKFQKENITW